MGYLDSLVNIEYTNLDYISVIINFVMCILMSFIARSFYINYSTSLTGKHHIGTVIPILATIVFSVILVVKSSLALSLGLVGALSIVRFRTPIKEPEELVYLFLSISIGLGYAAGYTFITTGITLSILFMVYMWLSNKSIGQTNEYNLVINWKNTTLKYEKIVDVTSEYSQSLKLIRLDRGPLNNTAVMLIVPISQSNMDNLTKKILEIDDSIDLSFFESKTNW